MMRFPFFTRRKPAAQPSLRAQARSNGRRALIRNTTDQIRADLGLPPVDWENL